jgi:hypothetical protein
LGGDGIGGFTAGIGTDGVFIADIGREIGPGFIVAAATAALFFSGCLPSATNDDSNVIVNRIAM